MADLQIIPFPFGNAGNMSEFGVLGAQGADRQNLTIGAETRTAPFSAYTMVRLLPQADCVIRIGVGATAVATTGDPLKSGVEAMRFVKEGERISVVAAA